MADFAGGRLLQRWNEQNCPRCHSPARFRVAVAGTEFFACGADLAVMLDGLAVRGYNLVEVMQYRMAGEVL